MKHYVLLMLAALALTGCTDAERAKFGSAGKEHTVTLWSGGVAAKTWTSTSMIHTESNSDGYYFKNKQNGKLVRVSGDVSIERN